MIQSIVQKGSSGGTRLDLDIVERPHERLRARRLVGKHYIMKQRCEDDERVRPDGRGNVKECVQLQVSVRHANHKHLGDPEKERAANIIEDGNAHQRLQRNALRGSGRGNGGGRRRVGRGVTSGGDRASKGDSVRACDEHIHDSDIDDDEKGKVKRRKPIDGRQRAVKCEKRGNDQRWRVSSQVALVEDAIE